MGHPALVSDSKMAIEWVKDSKGIDQIVLRNPRGASAKFSNCGSLEQQGFVGNKLWIVDEAPPPLPAKSLNGSSFIDLLLKPSEEDLKIWPHSFELRLRVCLGLNGNLTLTEMRVEGLETMDYLDNLRGNKERFTEQGDAITFEAEFDRLYLGSPNIVSVLDHERKRTYVIRREGLSDVGKIDRS
nr:putative glucose-6-phosphate 1-epimerase [Tanacetum cinerariifolium]